MRGLEGSKPNSVTYKWYDLKQVIQTFYVSV